MAATVLGLAWIGAAFLMLGPGLVATLLVLPLAVLVLGLVWSAQAYRVAHLPEGREARSAPAPSMSVDPPDTENLTVSSTLTDQLRQRAAEEFDLSQWMVDELVDRTQCANCGRYRHLEALDRNRVRCSACGSSHRVGRVQPDTRVRTFVDDVAPTGGHVDPTTGPLGALVSRQDG